MRYRLRPLGAWTDPTTKQRTSSGLFRAGWDATLALLADEVDHLDGQDPVIIQVDITESDLRQDGRLRANSGVGSFPGVVISFQSRFGPLRYASDAYEQRYTDALPSWQANVRAVALALEALRAVDRYGVTKRGQQYTGWAQLTGARAGISGLFTEPAEALRWLQLAADLKPDPDLPFTDQVDLYKMLAKRLHPDAEGGSKELWDRLDAAATLLQVRKNGDDRG